MMNIESNFVRTIMEDDLASGKVDEIITRFPPEPNAYLHIGHARAIVMNFELAKAFGGKTNLRFDDTNPLKEDTTFVEAIKHDIRWLGYEPDKVLFGSDYFDQTYLYAVKLIKEGLAFVCDLSPEEISQYRGTLKEPGKESPWRNRSVEENLRLFEEMKNGKYADGEKTLRAKINMAHPNMNMRDPVIYRIIHTTHHNTKDKWCIYPMYDFAHPIQDAIEGITHSLCSLEYEDHRVLYDWFIEKCEPPHTPHQYEFGRLNIPNTIMSKRYLRELVEENLVEGYDDPRMPTLAGLRRRGITPKAIKEFIISAGLSRQNSTVSIDMLDTAVRNDLQPKTKRIHAVVDPLKVIITNYPEDKIESQTVSYHPNRDDFGERELPFGREVYIERQDFLPEKPNRKWRRLSLGEEVRLMHAYFITCNDIIYDEDGSIKELHCTYDKKTKSGSGFKGRKPNGNLHFVEKSTGLSATFNMIGPLLSEDDEDEDLSFKERLNPDSMVVQEGYVEPSVKDAKPGDRFQFMRLGYYVVDKTSSPEHLVFNKTVDLRGRRRKK